MSLQILPYSLTQNLNLFLVYFPFSSSSIADVNIKDDASKEMDRELNSWYLIQWGDLMEEGHILTPDWNQINNVYSTISYILLFIMMSQFGLLNFWSPAPNSLASFRRCCFFLLMAKDKGLPINQKRRKINPGKLI